MASKQKKILIRTGVGGALAAVLAYVMSLAYSSPDGLSVWVPGAIFTIGCIYEVAGMSRAVPKSLRSALLIGLLVALAPGALHYFGDAWSSLGLDLSFGYLSHKATLVGYLAPALAFMVVSQLVGAGRSRLRLCLGLSLWAFAPMTAITFLWHEYGPDGLVALIVLSKIGDVFGYYVGSAIGKTHPFPNTSPGKTTAGCVASLIVGTLAGGAFASSYVGELFSYHRMLPSGELGVLGGFLGGALVNIAAQAGDLYESRIKRLAEVKDSGSWFGPSGGVLDLADSLLFSVPMALLTWPLLFA
jgi:CDP-diglyceride synthetase